MLHYALVFHPEEDGSILVTCPDLPEVTTFGETEEDATRHGIDAVQEAIAARLDDFRDIPFPVSHGHGKATLGLHLSLVVNLFWALRAAGMNRAELGRRLGWHRTQVDRLFDPNHESKISQFEAAFEALHAQPSIDFKDAA